MPIEFESILIAVENMNKMVIFYNTVFDADLQPSEPFADIKAFKGQLAGIELMLVPNSIAQVDAKRNRHQFQFIVDDVDSIMATALNNHGTLLDEAGQRGERVSGSVYDPDENSIVFFQRDSQA